MPILLAHRSPSGKPGLSPFYIQLGLYIHLTPTYVTIRRVLVLSIYMCSIPLYIMLGNLIHTLRWPCLADLAVFFGPLVCYCEAGNETFWLRAFVNKESLTIPQLVGFTQSCSSNVAAFGPLFLPLPWSGGSGSICSVASPSQAGVDSPFRKAWVRNSPRSPSVLLVSAIGLGFPTGC